MLNQFNDCTFNDHSRVAARERASVYIWNFPARREPLPQTFGRSKTRLRQGTEPARFFS